MRLGLRARCVPRALRCRDARFGGGCGDERVAVFLAHVVIFVVVVHGIRLLLVLLLVLVIRVFQQRGMQPFLEEASSYIAIPLLMLQFVRILRAFREALCPRPFHSYLFYSC
jgi:hypothetical protein